MGKIEAKNIIKRLDKLYSNILFVKEVPYAVIRAVFLKYSIDNNIGAKDKNNEEWIEKVKQLLRNNATNLGPNSLHPFLLNIDKEYKLSNIISFSIEDYEKDLFCYETEAKENARKEVMIFLSCLNFREDMNNTYEIGKELVNGIAEYLSFAGRKNFGLYQMLTSNSIIELSSKILDVNKNDSYLDLMSGSGISTINICKNGVKKIYSNDVDIEASYCSAMIYIMFGIKNFEQYSFDIFNRGIDINADKIFVDAPLGGKIIGLDNKISDSNIYSLKIISEHLNLNGKAVQTITGNFFFGKQKGIFELKKKLINQGILEAVVSLPPLYYGTNIPSCLVLLSNKNNKEVTYIDATQNDVINFYEKNEKNMSLTSDGIDKINEIISNKKTIKGVSIVKSYEEIIENEYDLTPAHFVDSISKEENISIEEIDKELQELYKKLIK